MAAETPSGMSPPHVAPCHAGRKEAGMKTGALPYAFHFSGEKVPRSLWWSPFGVYWLEEHHLPSSTGE